MSYNYYAVKVGKTPVIYTSWDDCKKNTHGYPNAKFKGFQSKEESENFLGELTNHIEKEKEEKEKSPIQAAVTVQEAPYAFVDGSFNAITGVYGFGGFLIHDNTKEILQGCGISPDMVPMRNVAGEILGSIAAIKKALELKLPELTIYYDYLGIEKWATGEWKRNKTGTIAYYNFIQEAKQDINLRFIKVKGHSGVSGNEEADKLAKEAVGIR